MDFIAGARTIVDGLKTFSSADLRDKLESVDRGLATVDHTVRTVNGVLDTIERSVAVGRDVLGNFHRSASPDEPGGARATGSATPGRAAGASQTRASESAEGPRMDQQASLAKAQQDAFLKNLQAYQRAFTDRCSTLSSFRRDSLNDSRDLGRRYSR